MKRMPALALGLSIVAASTFMSADAFPASASIAHIVHLKPGAMPRIGTVDERYQSFNVEMLEVTGGAFWKPYAARDADRQSKPNTTGADSNGSPHAQGNLYQYRPPIDLSNKRLRMLAAALGPSYMRVSGTWANTTYFHDADTPAPKTPPAGFNGVLTRPQWKGVMDFAHAVDARVVTSFAIGAGVRDPQGFWTPTQAGEVLEYTRSIGGSIAAAEFMNEPTLAALGGAPENYDPFTYGRDLAVFVRFIRRHAPDTLVLGPGSVGEDGSAAAPVPGILKSEDLLAAAGPVFDAFSYHFYGALSERCAATMPAFGTTAAGALSSEWLERTADVEKFYARLRDRFEPGRPMWLTETADAACGGNRWASTFLDTFRYVDQLARMARRGVQVVAHNTLAASDYGLLDETSYRPRPSYWAALIWRRLMGTTVLDPGPSPSRDLRLYAHCLRGAPGGVAVLVINTELGAGFAMDIPFAGHRYTLTAKRLQDGDVQLNGRHLLLGVDDALPSLVAVRTRAGTLRFASASITFVALPDAGNPLCA